MFISPLRAETSLQAFFEDFNRVVESPRKKVLENVIFLDPKGQEAGWNSLNGQYLLINFWATWCPPCVVELPSLENLQAQYNPEQLQVIAISTDANLDQETLKGFLDKRDIGNFAAYHDHKQEVQKKVPMRGLPTTYLLSPEREILYVFEGDSLWDSKEAQAFFDGLITPNQ